MPQLQPDLAFRALSLLLLTLLAVILVVFTLISMWKENRFGWPLRGIILFYLGLLAGYVQKASSLVRVSLRMEAATLYWNESLPSVGFLSRCLSLIAPPAP
jgi:hypothetical protein